MEKMYRVLLANGSEEFCGKLGVALKRRIGIPWSARLVTAFAPSAC